MSGADVFWVDYSEGSAMDRISGLLKGASLFGGPKVIVTKNIAAKRKANSNQDSTLADILREYKVAEDKNTVVVLTDSGIPKDVVVKIKKIADYIKATKSTMKEMSFLRNDQLEMWVGEEVALRQRDADKDAIRELVMRAGPDTWTLAGEIDKLCSYTDKTIIKADVLTLVAPRLELNTFQLTDALAQKNKSRAMEVLYRLLDESNEPYVMLAAITYQFRLLLMARDLYDRRMARGVIVNKLGVHPYAAGKACDQAGRFTVQELKDRYAELFRIDTQTKEGRVNLVDELYGFVLG